MFEGLTLNVVPLSSLKRGKTAAEEAERMPEVTNPVTTLDIKTAVQESYILCKPRANTELANEIQCMRKMKH